MSRSMRACGRACALVSRGMGSSFEFFSERVELQSGLGSHVVWFGRGEPYLGGVG